MSQEQQEGGNHIFDKMRRNEEISTSTKKGILRISTSQLLIYFLTWDAKIYISMRCPIVHTFHVKIPDHYMWRLTTIFYTKMHSSRMRTAHLLTVSHSIPCISWGIRGLDRPRGCRIPLPDADSLDVDPAGGRPPQMQTPWRQTPRIQTPSHVTCDALVSQPPCGQTITCVNITLPQTSFAGGRNTHT